MTNEPGSPKRRHILSSINPELRRDIRKEPQTSPPADASAHEDREQTETRESVERTEHKSSKFRFKSKHSHSHSHSHRSSRHRERDYENGEVDQDRDNQSSHHRRHEHRRHHRHHPRHKRRRSRSPTPQNPHEPPPLDSDAAFRESLFDAMADDEGAAYWESVYGQPIHVYPNMKPTGPLGELEQMDDEEYAAYVRQKMWGKTFQGLLEERARREAKKKEKDTREHEARRLTKEMEESLRRGQERRRRKGWKDKWEEYAAGWAAWDGTLDGMKWPVASGRRKDIDGETVRDFFVHGIDPVEVGETAFYSKLKEERVRWHPDKMQQKLGERFDDAVSRDVTAVFQIIDKLWSDTRSKTKS